MGQDIIIRADNIKRYFRMNNNYTVKAVDGVSLSIRRDEVYALVGESGSGKSTVARLLTGIYRPTEGTICYNGIPVTGRNASREQHRFMHRQVQTVFQDSAAALNPRMKVRDILREPLHIHGLDKDRNTVIRMEHEILQSVGLADSVLLKYPAELSGGQRQRIAIARCLLLHPQFIVADEPIASLDISIQAQIVMLFKRLQREEHFSMLFIAHDLSIVRFISDRVSVMLRGRIVETAPTEELFTNPMHPYTQALLSAIHVPDPIYERNKHVTMYHHSAPLGEHFIEKSPGHFVLE